MDMSRSSKYRIKEAVNILKTIEQLIESKDFNKLDLVYIGIRIKVKNPYMTLAAEDDESEVWYVPHMLTHQEYKYMMEHLEELMNE